MMATAALFSEVRFLTEYFIRAMSAQGTVIAVLRQLQNMRGPAKRLTELYDTLAQFDHASKASTVFQDNDSVIEFKNCQVYTPTGNLLVKDLNFKIIAGTSMLLTGCNGSGKSSIFRCLGSLWSVPEGGTITKPGGGQPGLNAAVFYVPQKPYNVLGTLKSQLLYPADAKTARDLSDEEMKLLLDKVDLGYLMDREDKDTEVNWETALSLGEKQRLAMARLYFHRPKFAILDECTSGVSAQMEKRLYDDCDKFGITCITISHRPVLEQWHDVVLNILADGRGGWGWRETTRGRNKRLGLRGAAVADTGEAAVGGYSKAYFKSGDALMERRLLEERSEKYRSLAEELRPADSKSFKDVPTSRRLRDILSKFLPDGFSLRDTEVQRIVLLCGLVIGKTLLADAVARFDGVVLSTIMKHDFYVFLRAISAGAFFRSFLSVFDSQLLLHKWYLNLEWRKRLTKYLMDLYFTGNTFYDIKNHDNRIPDPEERITEQVEQLSISITELWTSLLKPAFDITFNSVVLYRTLGSRGVLYTSGYMFGGLLAMRYVVPNFRAIRKREMDLEGKFRFVHTRLIDHTESIAFFGGDDVEHEVADTSLNRLADHIRSSQLETLRFNIFNNFTIKQTPDLVAFALRMFFARGFLNDEAVLSGDGSEISQGGIYIQQTVLRSFQSFGDAFDLQETIGQFFGVLENVTDLMYVLEDLAHSHRQKPSNVLPSEDGSIRFSHVDIVAPGNTCCVSDLNVAVKPGHPLVVTGPNASGKSSLFRTLGGLWDIPCGKIFRPCNEEGIVTPEQVFLVPQKPYSVTGSLANQITYPKVIPEGDFTEDVDKELRKLLAMVKVEYLVDREGGWHTVAKWEDTLSLGEQQRIGCARLFYHQPQFCVIDEATSAVSVDVEEQLYRLAHERGITSITISQRLALEEFHDQELMMGDANGVNGWAIRDIVH